MIYKTISTTKSQVGKYVDINGDGIPEGVIFADLAVGGKGYYGIKDGLCKFEIPTIKEDLKDYIVVGEYDDQINGKQEVLSPILDGSDRFYIMGFNDYSGNWYKNAIKSQINNHLTKQKFGAGRQNTINILNKWKSDAYGQKDGNDLWNYIQNDVKNGWFIPSKAEWAAFAYNLTVCNWIVFSNYPERGTEYYTKKGLSNWYWTSSRYNSTIENKNMTFGMRWDYGIDASDINVSEHVRLALTI